MFWHTLFRYVRKDKIRGRYGINYPHYWGFEHTAGDAIFAI
ncbi:hypothetical protein TF3313_2650 [Tannerella forsythia 3313]|nr:hypothetical protein TF3313_2650 [Tannerella forsythia 3313]